MTFSIHTATPHDAQDIAFIHVHTWKTAYAEILPHETLQNLRVEDRTARWTNILSNPNPPGHTLLARSSTNDPLGFVSYGPNRDYKGYFSGEIYAIYILSTAQRSGLGKALMLAAAQHLLQMDLRSATVTVLAENPARSFYQALGGVLYTKTSTQIAGHTFPEEVYAWRDLHTLGH